MRDSLNWHRTKGQTRSYESFSKSSIWSKNNIWAPWKERNGAWIWVLRNETMSGKYTRRTWEYRRLHRHSSWGTLPANLAARVAIGLQFGMCTFLFVTLLEITSSHELWSDVSPSDMMINLIHRPVLNSMWTQKVPTAVWSLIPSFILFVQFNHELY